MRTCFSSPLNYIDEIHTLMTITNTEKPDNNMLQIVLVNDLITLESHKSAWNNLAINTPPYLPTCAHAWLASYFEHFVGKNEKWVCFFAYKNSILVGVLPLIVKNNGKFITNYQTLHIPNNSETLGVSPLLTNDNETDVFRALMDSAWSNFPKAIYIEIHDLPIEPPFLHQESLCHIRRPNRIGRYLPVTGNQDNYQASLSKNFRNNQKKSSNKLEKLSDVRFEFLVGENTDPAYLTEYCDVEMASWKGREGTAIKCSEKMTAFYTSLTKRLSDAGWLEWHILRAEGHAIAINLAIKFHNGIILWKLGYDDAYAKCSPGSMLFQKLLDRVFTIDDIKEINLLTDANWYDNWNMENREYQEIRFYNTRQVRSLILGFAPDFILATARKNKFLRSLARTIRKQIKA